MLGVGRLLGLLQDLGMGPEGTLTLSWLIRLRWAAVPVYSGLVAWALWGLELSLPLGLMGSLLLVAAASNLGLQALWDAEGPGPRGLTGGVLVLDTLVLTGLLYASGGPANPCSALYLSEVALAASALGSRWGWAVALLSMGGYGLLFPYHQPLGHLDHAMGDMGWHLWGMWAGLAATSGLIAHFVGHLSDAHRAQQTETGALRERAERDGRLAAITALAAGAAHELATPLGTIALAVQDLDPADPDSLAEDVALIRSEVARCRKILDGLAHEGGQLVGEVPQTLDLRAWGSLAPANFIGQIRLALKHGLLRVPPRGFDMVLRALVKNALEAAGPEAVIDLTGQRVPGGAYLLTVEDPGPGFSGELLSQVGGPFLTTKGEEGLGLGLFLARGYMERLGGRLEVDSRPGCTRVSLVFPPEVVI